MYSPIVSNLRATAAAASISVSKDISGNTQAAVSVTIANALLAIQAYITSAPNTAAARRLADVVAQKFNELVAAVNAFSA